MDFFNYDFLYGCIGFIGFEAIRIYKKLTDKGIKETPFPKGYVIVYISVIIIIIFFSGTLSSTFALKNPLKSIFIGFSVPSCIKTFIGKNILSILSGGEKVDDTKWTIVKKSEVLKRKFTNYFTF